MNYPIGTRFVVNVEGLWNVKVGDVCVVTGYDEDTQDYNVIFEDGQPSHLSEQSVLNNYLVRPRKTVIIL